MGLAVSDESAHSPLMVHIRHESLGNNRVRSEASDARRRSRNWNRFQVLAETEDYYDDDGYADDGAQ